MSEKTHDLRGNMVDGWYWILLEEIFQKSATTFRGAGNNRAAKIAERLVAATDDVPAQLMQDFWDCTADLDPDDPEGTLEELGGCP